MEREADGRRSRDRRAAATRPGRRVRLVVVDGHVAVRRGLELLLRGDGQHLVGSAGDAAHGFELVVRRRPELALIELALPDESGPALTRRLLRAAPELRVLVYTADADRRALAEALACGAAGLASKLGTPEELRRAVRAVAAGDGYVDPRLRPLLAERRPGSERAGELLSPREREVLSLLAGGLSGERIAERLHLSSETVRTHVRNAMGKLDASTRVHAVALALGRGELERD